MILLLSSCNVTKHIETSKQEITDNKIETVEQTDKNTVKYITITEYQTVYDTITKEYPVKSVTFIKEENKDKITSNTKEEQHVEEQEVTTEDKKTEFKLSGYIWCFVAGCVITILLIIIFKLVWN